MKEYDLRVDVLQVRGRARPESVSRTAHSLLATLSVQSPYKLLHLWPSDGPTPPLGLQVDDVQPQPVLADHAVDAPVSGLANGLSSIRPRATIAHLQQQFDDHLLE